MRLLRSLVLVAHLAVLAACASVPFDYPKEHSVAIAGTADTTLGREVNEWTAAHSGLSGFYPLIEGMDAFAARLHLVEAAEISIDLQYFLMKDDTAGHILAAALLRAADRGVRIRFLLDDVFTTVDDEALIHLDQHDDIEVRLFNPLARGGVKFLNFAFDFKRANRRMHNKSFTVDNQVTIVGGRNIADEYFELKTEAEFLDFDVIGVGQVAADVSDSFDVYWNDDHAVPIAAFAKNVDPKSFDAWRAEVENDFQDAHQSAYARAMTSGLIADLVNDTIPMHPANYRVIVDDPGKLTAEISEEHQALVNHLVEVAEEADSEIIVVTPYFVPLESGVEFWRSMTDKGLRVVILTNSLASNNHTAVHSAYSKYRRPIIEAGVELYEARVDAVSEQPGTDAPAVLTLHTKAVIIDRDTLFAGSLNLDPRSIDINAESGVLVHSPELVGGLVDLLLEDLPGFAYRVELDESNKLTWRVTDRWRGGRRNQRAPVERLASLQGVLAENRSGPATIK